jgi:RNA polymerase sigma-70 factor (ECF subfamily)
VTFRAAVGDPARSTDERELLRRAARGEVEAFDILLSGRLDRLYRMAMAITRNDADARDAVQDACVHAWRSLPGLRDPSRFDAWLAQVLVNASRGVLRRRKRTAGREVGMESDAGDAQPEVVGADPIAGVGEAEAIRRAFERLSPDDRILLALHYVEQRPLAEIATAMRSPVGTIKWRLSRARRALERALEVEDR